MTDVETLEERVSTVERAVTDGDHGFPAVDDLAELTERVESLEEQIETLRDRADELEAATQALRGYVGNVRSVNERVEGRADAALAATERLERRLDAATDGRRPPEDGPGVGDAGESDPGPGGSPTPRATASRDGPDGADGIGGATRESDTDGTAGTDSTQRASTTESRDSGVLEQIRSLL